MTSDRSRGARVVLLDIEGTTTPIAFVYDILFPFARAELASWCRRHAGSDPYRRVMTELAAEHAADRGRGERVPAWDEGTAEAADRSLQTYVRWLMDVDRKSPGLKRLQGLIWEEGYRAGTLRGEVYPDVPGALARWHAAGIRTAIYSSGSELAQKRLFESTPSGDLSAFIDRYFDTAVGPKGQPASYSAIASQLHVSPHAVVFVSDVTAELSAAARAGCETVLCVRPGNPSQADAAAYRQITSFEELNVADTGT